MSPSISTLIKRNGTIIQHMDEGLGVFVKVAFDINSFAPSAKIAEGWQKVNGGLDSKV